MKAALPCLVALLAGCATPPPTIPAFYDAAQVATATAPGTLLASEPIAFEGARAVRILYATTGLDERPRVASAVVVAPAGAAPDRPRPVVAWAHPTTGVARHCAPSLRPQVFATIPGLPDFLARGYVVVAPDYPGLGTAGVHPYLVGLSEGRAVLDGVRAARQVTDAQAGPRFVAWGHSQGGQSALFAGELARDYAPELAVAGIAVAAPATDLARLFAADADSLLGRVVMAYAFWSWAQVYGVDADSIVVRGAAAAMDAVARDCGESTADLAPLREDVARLPARLLAKDPTQTPPWDALLARNTPGRADAGAPLFVAQGDADTLVEPEVTRAFVAAACARGERVRVVAMPGVAHIPSGRAAAPQAVAWIADRFADVPAPSDCVPR